MKRTVVFQPRSPSLIFGDPIDAARKSTDTLALDRIAIAEIYRYVREDVAPRFARFFK